MDESTKKIWGKIRNKDFNTILKKVGIISSFNNLIHALYSTVIPEEVQEIINEWEIATNNRDVDRLERAFKKIKDFIDIDAYVVLAHQMVKNGQFSIDKKSGNIFLQDNMFAQLFEAERLETERRLEQLVPECNAIIEDVGFKKETLKVIFSKHTKASRQSIEKTQKRLDEIKKDISIDELLKDIDLLNTRSIIRYGSVVREIGYVIKEDSLTKMEEVSQNVFNVTSYNNEFLRRILVNNIELCDLDNLLALAIINKFMEFQSNPTQQSFEETKNFYELAKSHIENKKLRMRYFESDNKPIWLSYDELEKCKNVLEARFINGKYCSSQEELEEIASGVYDGKFPYDYISPLTYSFFKYTQAERGHIFMHDINSIKYFLENNIIAPEEAGHMIELLKNKLSSDKNIENGEREDRGNLVFNSDTVNFLLGQDLLNANFLLNLYLNGAMSLESVELIDEERREDLLTLLSIDNLANLYISAKDGKDEAKYNRFAKLYRNMIMNSNNHETRNELSQELLEKIGDFTFEEENLFELYRDGVLTCDVVTSFAGIPAIKELYASGEMKPVDARRLFEDGIITKDMLAELFKSKEIEEEKKIALIFSTFSADEDAEIRDELLKYLSDTKAQIKKKAGEKDDLSGEGRNGNVSSNGLSKTYLINPAKRWNFINALDDDYSQECCADGHIIFKLPNHRTYVIEKIFATGSKKNFSTGTASYFVSEEFFDEHRDEIILEKTDERANGKAAKYIDRHTLVSCLDNANVHRITHGGEWAKKVCVLFGIYNEDGKRTYSKEDIARIEELARDTDKSKTLYALGDVR